MSQDETFEKFVANHQQQLEALQIPRNLWRVLSDKVPPHCSAAGAVAMAPGARRPARRWPVRGD